MSVNIWRSAELEKSTWHFANIELFRLCKTFTDHSPEKTFPKYALCAISMSRHRYWYSNGPIPCPYVFVFVFPKLA